MSNNEDLKKQLETIQNQLDQMNKAILQTRIDVMDSRKNMLENQIINMKNELLTFNTNLKLSQDQIRTQMKISNVDLYWSIFLSAIIGVVGNQFVTLLYAPQTEANLWGLIGAGISLVGLLSMLIYWMFKSQQALKTK